MRLLRSILHLLWMAGHHRALGPDRAASVSIFASAASRIYWLCAEQWLKVAPIGGTRVLLGIQTRITGFENLPDRTSGAGAVLLVKHQSTLGDAS
jgi:1-acyl-sn-glycerol-3-phosphate acyltransferase